MADSSNMMFLLCALLWVLLCSVRSDDCQRCAQLEHLVLTLQTKYDKLQIQLEKQIQEMSGNIQRQLVERDRQNEQVTKQLEGQVQDLQKELSQKDDKIMLLEKQLHHLSGALYLEVQNDNRLEKTHKYLKNGSSDDSLISKDKRGNDKFGMSGELLDRRKKNPSSQLQNSISSATKKEQVSII